MTQKIIRVFCATDLKKDAVELQKLIDFDDTSNKEFKDSRDDEYRMAGVFDPKIVITTARDPSSRLKAFTKEMKLMFPNSQRLNRGGYVRIAISWFACFLVSDFATIRVLSYSFNIMLIRSSDPRHLW